MEETSMYCGPWCSASIVLFCRQMCLTSRWGLMTVRGALNTDRSIYSQNYLRFNPFISPWDVSACKYLRCELWVAARTQKGGWETDLPPLLVFSSYVILTAPKVQSYLACMFRFNNVTWLRQLARSSVYGYCMRRRAIGKVLLDVTSM